MGEKHLAVGWLLLTLLFAIEADGTTKGALKTDAAKKICTKSKEIKGTILYVTKELNKLKAFFGILKSREAHLVQKISMESQRQRCEKEVDLLLMTRRAFRETHALFKKMATMGVQLAGASGLAAGRIDEFISVFQQTRGSSANERCIIGTLNTVLAAKPSDLPDCYVGGPQASDTAEFVHPDDEGDFGKDILEKFQSSGTGGVFDGPDVDSSKTEHQLDVTHQKCRLTGKGSGHGAIDGAAVAGNVKWGGGIVEFTGNGNANELTWKKNGDQIPTFRRAAPLLSSFNDEKKRAERRKADFDSLWGNLGASEATDIEKAIDRLDNATARELRQKVDEWIAGLPDDEKKTEESFKRLIVRNCVKEPPINNLKEFSVAKELNRPTADGSRHPEIKLASSLTHETKVTVVLTMVISVGLQW